MNDVLLPTEPSLDDEITCHNCQRDLEGRGVCFLRIEDVVQALCYGCVAQMQVDEDE